MESEVEEKRKKLDEWRERVGYAEAAKVTQQAALRGTEMHFVLENYINGKGYLNLGLRWSATENLMLELNFNDNFKNIKYLNVDDSNNPTTFKSRSREIKVIYFEQF